MFEHFNYSLYDKRWHEVYKFLRALRPLLRVLRCAWDAQKFLSGYRPDGGEDDVMLDLGRLGRKREAAAGADDSNRIKFDPKAITQT